MPKNLKKLVKSLFLFALAITMVASLAVSAQARLEIIATSGDGSFCAKHYNEAGVYDFDVCYSASTGEYTFF